MSVGRSLKDILENIAPRPVSLREAFIQLAEAVGRPDIRNQWELFETRFASLFKPCTQHPNSRRLKTGDRCLVCYQQIWVARKKWLLGDKMALEIRAAVEDFLPSIRKEQNRRQQRLFRRADPEHYRRKDRLRNKTPRRRRSTRSRHLVLKYGITLDEYESMLVKQSGRCAICGTTKPGGRGTFSVDHCHRTTRVRGLLCSQCNTGIGLFYEDPLRLQKAIAYLTP